MSGKRRGRSWQHLGNVAAIVLLLALSPRGLASAQSSSSSLTVPARSKLDGQMFPKDRVETKARSITRALFGGRITVTSREPSDGLAFGDFRKR